MQAAIGGHQGYSSGHGELDVQRIHEPQLVSTCPRSAEKVAHGMALDRSGGEVVDHRLGGARIEIAGPVQPSQCRENLSIRVRG